MTTSSMDTATVNATCPACGSDDLKVVESSEMYSAPFGPAVQATLHNHHCNVCGFEGDFSKENDALIRGAVERSERASVEAIIGDLSEMQISMAFMERTLGLPIRTISRWKGGEHSAAGTALLRIVRAFPWVLDAAEARYAPSACVSIVVSQAAHLLARAASQHQIQWQCSVSGTLEGNDGADLNVHLARPARDEGVSLIVPAGAGAPEQSNIQMLQLGGTHAGA